MARAWWVVNEGEWRNQVVGMVGELGSVGTVAGKCGGRQWWCRHARQTALNLEWQRRAETYVYGSLPRLCPLPGHTIPVHNGMLF